MRDDGVKYEEYCCKYLQEKGYTTKTTVTSGDQGADIIAERDGIKIAVQCKYRTEGSIGNDAIQQALAGKMYYDCDIALVITNVNFTSQAVSAAKKLKVKIWPNIRMKTKFHDSKKVDSEYDSDDLDDASLSPFIFGVSSVFADIDKRIKYGNALINSRFEVPYVPQDKEIDPEKDNYSNDHMISNSETDAHLNGKSHALKMLTLINDISNYHFEIVDWFFSSERDKNLFVFETEEIINVMFRFELENELNGLFDLEVTVNCPTRHSVVVSIINNDKNKTNDINELFNFTVKYISDHTRRSFISTDTDDNLVKYERLESVIFHSRGDKAQDYELFYRFTSKEQIESNILTSLETAANAFFRRRLIIRRMDGHSFALCIKKSIGLDDYLTLIDTHIYRGYNFAHILSMTTGICDDTILFNIKLKKVDTSLFTDSLSDEQSMAIATAYIEQIRYYVMGLFDLTMIDCVKEGTIKLPLCKCYKGYWAEGIRAVDIIIKVVDSNNNLIFIEKPMLDSSNGLTVFPLSDMYHYNFIGRNNACSMSNIGLNAMMIQKTLRDLPKIDERLGSYYIIDTLKKMTDAYIGVLDNFVDTFIKACKNLELHNTSDNNLIRHEERFYRDKYYFNVRQGEITEYHNNEYDPHGYNKDTYFFWKINSTITNRNLIWIDPDKDNRREVDDITKDIIEKYFDNSKIDYRLCGNSFPNEDYLLYKIQGELDVPSVESELNQIIRKDDSLPYERIYIYVREQNKYAFVCDCYGDIYYDPEHITFQRIKHQKKEGKPLSYWMIDLSIKPFCAFQSFFCAQNDKYGLKRDFALLAIKLKDVSVKSLEMLNSATSIELLWGNWNDIIYSLISLMNVSSGYNDLQNDDGAIIIREGIELYDKNNVLIARLYDNSIKYSYFQCFDIASNEDYDSFFDFRSRHFISYEEYKEDIVPLLNQTLQNAISSLEALSQ